MAEGPRLDLRGPDALQSGTYGTVPEGSFLCPLSSAVAQPPEKPLPAHRGFWELTSCCPLDRPRAPGRGQEVAGEHPMWATPPAAWPLGPATKRAVRL